MKRDEVKLEDRLGCFGYFGFGGGYRMAKDRLAGLPGRESYCNEACRRAAKCWDRHRQRVRGLMPDLCAVADKVVADGFKGGDYILELMKRVAELEGKPVSMDDQTCEPFVLVMVGNLEDGICVGEGVPPKDRAQGSLTWPLLHLE